MARETSHQQTTATGTGELYEQRSGWVGWIFFAAVMMILAGSLNAIHGLVAILNDEWVVWSNRGDLYLDLTTWGWVHLVVGVVVVLAGFGLLTGNVLARAIAVALASISVIVNFLYIPAYPLWALTVITINVFVIYALTAHGRDIA
ncbi:MAG: hypothetical protein JXA83_10495 [Acidimicrobiales bacterium]|nr:hypothetical protein [Acidimicrobiales bacterium]